MKHEVVIRVNLFSPLPTNVVALKRVKEQAVTDVRRALFVYYYGPLANCLH